MNDGSLSREGLSGDAKVAYSYPDPGWMMGIVGFGPNNQSDPARRVLTFTTEPLAQDLETPGRSGCLSGRGPTISKRQTPHFNVSRDSLRGCDGHHKMSDLGADG